MELRTALLLMSRDLQVDAGLDQFGAMAAGLR